MKFISKIKVPEWATAGVAFVYYWIMALYKLTTTPIWQDEAMEYYCSIPVKGAIRGITEYTTMYERMAYIQQQPPLYNWLMCIWLQIHDSEWWFRFSSVVFVFGAVIALYLIVRKLCNKNIAAFSVIVYSSIYILMYYVKEASEYSLLIMVLLWGIYLYILMLDQITLKRILLFIVFCIVAVYTHYSAVFVIIPMSIGLMYILIKQKRWKLFKLTIACDVLASVIGGGILLYFYIIPQTTNRVSTLFSKKEIIIERGSIFGDFLNSIMCVFRWCTIDVDRDWDRMGTFICITIVILVLISLYSLIKTNSKYYKTLFWINASVYIIYYIITKLNIYAYGWYGNRYNMFLLPLWFIMTVVSLYEFIQILKSSQNLTVNRSANFIKWIILVSTVLYCCYGDYRIHNHWWKMDLRTVVAEWYEHDGEKIPTLVDYHQRYAFVYYFTHNEKYEENQWSNIISNETVETYSADDTLVWIEYLNQIYNNEIPKQLYLVTGQWNTLTDAFVELGYDVEPVVDTTAKLYLVEKVE